MSGSRSSLAAFPDLPRPRAATPGPLDERFWDLVEARFRRLVHDHPEAATWFGIHTEDGRMPLGSREAVLGEIESERRHLAAVEALDPEGLSADARFERDLEIHNLRRGLFDLEVHRVWERRSTAMDTVGDALFLLFARDFAPLADRLASVAARLEGVPTFLAQSRERAAVPQVRAWQRLEIESAAQIPGLFFEMVAAGRDVLRPTEQRHLEAAAARASEAVAEYSAWLRTTIDGGTDDWALGREAYDQLVGLRGFGGLDADAILEIGRAQLATNRQARVATAREIDPTADEATVVDRVKRDHPATFEEALEGYRSAMLRARQHIIDRRLATIPKGERIEVIATPEFLRNVLPFAAYMESPKFDRNPKGLYIVTPSVGDDPAAMREHNWSSISNTSVHEAYPGHHLQLTVAGAHPSLVRLTTEAPEFVEGWGMYSEQMMREQGFDDGPAFRLALYTDAIWRACRIILDVRMHRGEMTVDEATRFLVEQTSFEGSNARAEVDRYTYTPTYQLSYLLGKVLLLELRADEQRRLGPSFSLQGFHDTLLRNGSLPISFHRRLLAQDPLDGASQGAVQAATAGRAGQRQAKA